MTLEADDDLALASGDFVGDLVGNASTATALAANGGNCSAGEVPAGVDASGAVESCDATPAIDGTDFTSIPSSAITTEVRSMSWSAGALNSDGTQCADPTEATIGSGPKQHTIICADNDASTFYGHTIMPDGWNAGTVTFELEYVQTALNTSALNSDITAMCRGDAEAINSNWGSEQAIDDAGVTGSSGRDTTTSAAVTPHGTCAAGDSLWFRWQLDATGTTTAVATLHFLGVKMEYTTTIGD